LGWPAYDTDAVWPEYALGGRRVDYALCSPPGKPVAFIEVKQIGQSDGAERQLFEYAFHIGVPMAILTDGREWHFFLPGEQGDYGERRVYKLDLAERDIGECVERLERYLLHTSVVSGASIQAARGDYRNVSKERQMLAALPKAWNQLIHDEDEMLVEIVADRVETLCGFKPTPDMVASFLKSSSSGTFPALPVVPTKVSTSVQPRPISNTLLARPSSPAAQSEQPANASIAREASQGQLGFTLDGQFYPARNAIDTLRQVFEVVARRDPSFYERFAGLPKHGRSRRYLARAAADLYPGREDLVNEHSVKLASGWWLSTNHSKQTILKIVAMVCDVAGLSAGKDLSLHIGD
jgi:predicted type IV restriction endonuclease